ncbi:MAG TPA: hypothetical protein VFB92_16885 [Vicinamibacterales bacterium]|nr:hypothetical protein [Vicinamibacterales bacterium]
MEYVSAPSVLEGRRAAGGVLSTARQRIFQIVLAVGGLLLVSVYAVAINAPATGLFHDDGIYVVTARALAEGQGYQIISLPQSLPQTKYPILFPWLLSLVWRVAPSFPDNLPLLRIVPLLATAIWLWLSWRLLLACGASRAAALAVVALTAVSPWVVFLGTALLSEMPFAALLTASLLLLTRVRNQTATIGRLCAFAGLLAGACFLTRTAGVAVLAGGLAWLIVTRRWLGAAAYGTAAAVIVIPWVGWVLWNAADTASYYSLSNYGSWNVVFHYAWREKFTVIAINALNWILGSSSLWGLDVTPWLVVPAALLAACALRGMWLTRRHPITWCVIAYTAIIMAWVWPPIRFLVPVMPLMLWQVSVAIRRIPVIPVAVVVATLITTSSAMLLRTVAHASSEGVMWFRAEGPKDWHRLSDLFDRIRQDTSPNAVLTGNLDPTYFLYTGRKAVLAFTADPYFLFYSSSPTAASELSSIDDFRRRLLSTGADYCVVTPVPGDPPYFRRLVEELARDVPGSLTLATTDVAAGYAVYRIDRDRLEDAERRDQF